MKLLVFGKNGQVGHELQHSLAGLGAVVALDRQDCDLARSDSIRAAIRAHAPDVIINAAAYTAVDRAESEPGPAMAINGVAPGVIGEEAAKLGALVVHYSTDYVFDGKLDRPYVETDATNPQSVYGRSKLAGEVALAQSGARHLILRTSWVVGAHGGNFAKTILRLARERDSLNVVADQWGAPTTAALIATVTAQLVGRYGVDDAFPFGIYHLAAAGETNWHGYAQHVVGAARAAGLALKLVPEAIRPVATPEYPSPAARPANSRLCTAKLRGTFGLDLPDWQAALEPILEQIFQES